MVATAGKEITACHSGRNYKQVGRFPRSGFATAVCGKAGKSPRRLTGNTLSGVCATRDRKERRLELYPMYGIEKPLYLPHTRAFLLPVLKVLAVDCSIFVLWIDGKKPPEFHSGGFFGHIKNFCGQRELH